MYCEERKFDETCCHLTKYLSTHFSLHLQPVSYKRLTPIIAMGLFQLSFKAVTKAIDIFHQRLEVRLFSWFFPHILYSFALSSLCIIHF